MAGTSWAELLTLTTADSAQVNGNLDYMEGDIFPHSSGTYADNLYYAGSSSYKFKGLGTKSFSPSSTTQGIAFGKAEADTSAALDLSAMQKALYVPVMTEAVRDGLTPKNGFIIYNSTIGRVEQYSNNSWRGISIPQGIVSKKVGYATATYSASASYVKILETEGSGRVLTIWGQNIGVGVNPLINFYSHNASLRVTIDGQTLGADWKYLYPSSDNVVPDITLTTACMFRRDPRADTTSALRLYADRSPFPEDIYTQRYEALDIHFNSSVLVEAKAEFVGGTSWTLTSTLAVAVLYEIS